MIKLISKISFLLVLLTFLSFQSSITQTQIKDIQIQQTMKAQDVSKGLKLSLDYGKIPLYFIPNEGQVNEKALFYAKASRYILWATKEGLIFDRIIRQDNEKSKIKIQKSKLNQEKMDKRTNGQTKSRKFNRDISRIIFLNANNNLEVVPVNTTEHKINYFLGNDKSKWRRDIQTSRAVIYKELYKNIDLKIYGIEKRIEYDFIVKPGGEVTDISLEYKDVKNSKIDKEGNLIIETRFSELRHSKPVCYQVIKGEKVDVDAKFKKIDKDTYAFDIKEYDEGYELIIDPLVLVYSTYLGGSVKDYVRHIAVDKKGAAYVTGETKSWNFPKKNYLKGLKTYSTNAFITKIHPNGSDLVYSTFLGGYHPDRGRAIAVDSKGAAYVTGETFSSNFPIKKPIQKKRAGSVCIFITKLHPKGNRLIYSTYLGGSYPEGGRAIAVDSKGAAYITGYTVSNYDFPLKNPFQKKYGGYYDAFVTKIHPKGGKLIYSTYLGGSDDDNGSGIAVDKKGAAYVIGSTYSTDFPTKKPFQKKLAKKAQDAFITKIHPKGNRLVYSTYLGGSYTEYGSELTVDSKGAVYATGDTYSTDFPTKNPLYASNAGECDAFITKIHPRGNRLVYSTYFGGSDKDYGNGIAVDSKGAAYVTGTVYSTDFPTKDPLYASNAGECDAFIAKILPSGSQLVYSTYLGGSDKDYGNELAVDTKGAVYATGDTYSTDFPTKDPIYASNTGECDVYITKINQANSSTATKNKRTRRR